MPNLVVYGRCFAKMWQMLWPHSYVDKCCLLSNLVDVMPGVAGGMATVVRVKNFNLSSGVLHNISYHIWQIVLTNKELNFLWNRTIFSWNTSFCQST